MKYKLISDKNYKCKICKKTIRKGEKIIIIRIGHMSALRYHESCYQDYQDYQAEK